MYCALKYMQAIELYLVKLFMLEFILLPQKTNNIGMYCEHLSLACLHIDLHYSMLDVNPGTDLSFIFKINKDLNLYFALHRDLP